MKLVDSNTVIVLGVPEGGLSRWGQGLEWYGHDGASHMNAMHVEIPNDSPDFFRAAENWERS
jgi:hypothetical protein